MATTPEQRQAQTAAARQVSIEKRQAQAAVRRVERLTSELETLGYTVTPTSR